MNKFIDQNKLKKKLFNEQLFGINEKADNVFVEEIHSNGTRSLYSLSMYNKEDVYSDIVINNVEDKNIFNSLGRGEIVDDGKYISVKWKVKINDRLSVALDEKTTRNIPKPSSDMNYTFIIFYIKDGSFYLPLIVAFEENITLEDYINADPDSAINAIRITNKNTKFLKVEELAYMNNYSARADLNVYNMIDYYSSDEEFDVITRDNGYEKYVYYNPDLCIRVEYNRKAAYGTVYITDEGENIGKMLDFKIDVNNFSKLISESPEINIQEAEGKRSYRTEIVTNSDMEILRFTYYINEKKVYEYLYTEVISTDKEISIKNIVSSNLVTDDQSIAISNPFMSSYQDDHVKFSYNTDYRNMSSFTSYIYDMNNFFVRGPLWIPFKISKEEK